MSTVRELPLGQAQPVRSPEWLQAARRARQLSWFSLAWMSSEGILGIATGLMAGSIALTAFGIQSVIEGVASLAIVWLFTGSRLGSANAEGRAQKFVAVQFFLLVPFVGYEAINKLVTGEHADTSYLGIALVATAAIGMRCSGSPSAVSPTSSEVSQREAKARRTFSAPISPEPSSSACWGTRSSAGGGSTRSPRS